MDQQPNYKTKISQPCFGFWFPRYNTKSSSNNNKIDKLDFTKIKNNCASENTLKKIKTTHRTGKKFYESCN